MPTDDFVNSMMTPGAYLSLMNARLIAFKDGRTEVGFADLLRALPGEVSSTKNVRKVMDSLEIEPLAEGLPKMKPEEAPLLNRFLYGDSVSRVISNARGSSLDYCENPYLGLQLSDLVEAVSY